MAVFGKIENFDIENDNWKGNAERDTHYFYAKEIVDDRKQTAFF